MHLPARKGGREGVLGLQNVWCAEAERADAGRGLSNWLVYTIRDAGTATAAGRIQLSGVPRASHVRGGRRRRRRGGRRGQRNSRRRWRAWRTRCAVGRGAEVTRRGDGAGSPRPSGMFCSSSTACVVDAVVTIGRSARRDGALQARAAWDRRQDLRAPAEQAPGAYNCCRTPPTPSGEGTRLACAAVRGHASGPPTSNDRPSRSKRIAAVVAPA